MAQVTFLQDLESLINRYSKENESDTPDYLLAEYLNNCLNAYDKAVKARDKWFGVDMWSENKLAKSLQNQDLLSQEPKELKQ